MTYFFLAGRGNHSAQVVLCMMLNKSEKGNVGGGEAGEKAKMTLDAGGTSVSEKSEATPGLQEPLLEIKK